MGLLMGVNAYLSNLLMDFRGLKFYGNVYTYSRAASWYFTHLSNMDLAMGQYETMSRYETVTFSNLLPINWVSIP